MGKMPDTNLFQKELRCSLHGTEDAQTVYMDVPSDYMLVIEFISGNISTRGTIDNIGEAYIVVRNSSNEPEYLFIDFDTPRPWRYSGSAPGFYHHFQQKGSALCL